MRTNSGATTIVQLPLAFVRSGYVYLDNGGIGYIGYEGDYWTRTAIFSSYAYYLLFGPTTVTPSDGYDHYGGFPLRCRTGSQWKNGDEK